MLALGVHLALLGLRPPPEGSASRGTGGAEALTLAAADAATAALVAEWERPPEVAEVEPPEVDVPAPPALPELAEPSIDSGPLLPSATPGLALPEIPDRPQMKAVTAPPPPQPVEHVSDVRPTARPDRPAPPPQEAPPAPEEQPAQRAAGQGGATQAGSAERQAVPGLSAGQRQTLAARWGAELRAQVERRKRYPAGARGASGSVSVRITVDRAGRLVGVAVASPSGHAALDQAAIAAVKAARFPAAPQGLSEPSYSFTLPMVFEG